MRVITLEVVGPSRFCPECKRWLARGGDEGAIIVNEKASAIVHAGPIEEDDLANGDPLEARLLSAECYRLLCRLRRFGRRLIELQPIDHRPW